MDKLPRLLFAGAVLTLLAIPVARYVLHSDAAVGGLAFAAFTFSSLMTAGGARRRLP